MQTTPTSITFEEIRELLAARFPIVAQGDTWFGFRWQMGEGRSLRFKLAMTSLSGEPRLLVMSPAAPERDLSAKKALEIGAAIGPSVVIEEGLYIVRQWLDLQVSTREDIERAISLVADGVLRLQGSAVAKAGVRVSWIRPFANFAD